MVSQIYNAKVLTPAGWVKDASVIIKDGLIEEIRNNSRIEENADTTYDARGNYVVPGGIEIHVHGGGGRDFMEGTEEAFRVAVNAHLKRGITAIFPTL